MGVNQTWHIKFKQGQAPPPALPLLCEVIQHGKHVPKSQLSTPGQAMISLLGASQSDQATQWLHTCRVSA